MFKIPCPSSSNVCLNVKDMEYAVTRLKREIHPCRHKEPKNISWQWSVRKGLEPSKCKDLCVSRKCPKPSFFPRFKKVFVPQDMKSCTKKPEKKSWKDLFSFLFSRSGSRPPLITCRRLQEIRRRACTDPASYECFKDDCCPPPVEWYGQAVIYDVPSKFPQPESSSEPKPCNPPETIKPKCILAQKGECPEPKEKFRIEEYAYKKPFEVRTCIEDIGSSATSFKCLKPCPEFRTPEGDKSMKLTCPSFDEFKEVEIPSQIFARYKSVDLPSLVCTGENGKVKEVKQDPIDIYGNRRSCEPKKLLKSSTAPVSNRSFHVQTSFGLNNSFKNYNESQIKAASQKSSNNSKGLNTDNKMPVCLLKESHYQPSKMGSTIRPLLTKSLCDFQNADGMYNPPEPYICKLTDKFQDLPSINPELLALAEKTRLQKKKKSEVDDNTNSVFKILSKATIDRIREEESAKLAKGQKVINPITQSKGSKNKLSLLKENYNNTDIHRTLMTEADVSKDSSNVPRTIMTKANIGPDFAKKKETKKNEENKETICAGCPGIKKAEQDAINPPPKSFIQCKTKTSGKCCVDVVESQIDPGNPYWKHKAKPLSACNKPRKAPSVQERDYGDMPCDQSKGKRKFHAFSSTPKLNTYNFPDASFPKGSESQENNNKKLEKALTNTYYKREWQVDKSAGSPNQNIHQVSEDAAEMRESYIKLFSNRAREHGAIKEEATECSTERFSLSAALEGNEPDEERSKWFQKKLETFPKENITSNILKTQTNNNTNFTSSFTNQNLSIRSSNPSFNMVNTSFSSPSVMNVGNPTLGSPNPTIDINSSMNQAMFFKENESSKENPNFDETSSNNRNENIATEKLN